MKTVKIEINGKEIEAQEGQTILEVVREQNLDEIPTLCHSPELKPYGSCFVCVVEIEGRKNLVPSCATKVSEGMKIHTKNDRIVQSRKTALELLLSNHYADCISPCKIGCPAHVDAQGYIALAAMGQYKKAVDLVRETNPLPAVCGRVCVRKCEVVCRRVDIDESVGINYIKRYVTDMPGAYDGQPECEPVKDKTIGIVGGGPSGLTAAWFLGKKGYKSVIYESMAHAGGMLRYGIPEYRLPKADLDKEIEYITRVGVEIKTNTRVGRDITLDSLFKKHNAVFAAPGAFAGKAMRVKGEFDTDGVVTGADFLVEKADNRTPLKGTIVVVGGGNTAMDCARMSWRLGANKVIILYRRTKNEMPADKLEIRDCLEEGIEIMELAAPVGIVKENNRIKALRCIRMQLGALDASGRRRPQPMEGSEFELPCELAISAIGQSPILEDLLTDQKQAPTITKWNTFEVDLKTMKTNVEGLFAGGDAADDGPTVVIDAISDGQKAAKAIIAYLEGKELVPEDFIVRKDFWAKPGMQELGEIKQSPRHEMNDISVEERKNNFMEVATGYEYEDMTHETDRCLSCGCIAYDYCDLRLYAEQYGVDMEKYKGYVRKHKVDDRHPYIIYDPNKCVLCSRCIRTCERILPVSALGLINRGFKTEMRPAMNDELIDTSCINCGNCVDACPTGALQIKFPFPGRAALITEKTTTHCGFCSVGCEINVNKYSDDRYFIEASGKPGEYLCHYGRFGNELFIKSQRLVHPRMRKGIQHKDISFRDAYKSTVEGLKEIAKKYGPESVAVFVYPDISIEEMFLASMIARDGLKTNNIGSIAMLETGVKSGVLDESFGFTASTSDRTALRDADLIICNNSDTQSEHLILSVEITDAVKDRGAKLITADSVSHSLETLAEVAVDPIRGRASIFWNGVIYALIEDGFFTKEEIAQIPGGAEFLDSGLDFSMKTVVNSSGVDEYKIQACVEHIKNAKKVVIVHSPDRSRDLAPGDIRTFANLILMMQAKGIKANLILPSLASNGAGMEISGADPKFKPGRIPVTGLINGATNRVELLDMLKSGKIKGVLIIGEDPMAYDRTASYFAGIEFMACIDWAMTETAQFADVSIPGTTYLESEGTRVNFEGNVVRFNPAITAISGLKSWQVLRNLLNNFGVEISGVFQYISSMLEHQIRKNLGELVRFYYNAGEEHNWNGKGKLVIVPADLKPSPKIPSLTPMAHYKRDIHDVGLKNFKVSSR